MVFDTETTGLPKYMKHTPNQNNLNNWPHIVQLSYIIYDTDTDSVLNITDHIIRVPEGVQITEENAAIHGITQEISQQGIPLNMALDEFMVEFDNMDLIIAHNIEFDKKMLMAELYRLDYILCVDKIHTSTKYVCTMQEGIDLCNIKAFTKIEKKEYIKWPTLAELCQHLFNYEPTNLHNALNDVAICLRCFLKMRFDVDVCEKNDTILQMINKLK
jgi:DNA polymerase III epsilon subunit-like protein